MNISDFKCTANKIEQIYKDRKLLNEMSSNAYEIVKNYDIDEVLDDLITIL